MFIVYLISTGTLITLWSEQMIIDGQLYVRGEVRLSHWSTTRERGCFSRSWCVGTTRLYEILAKTKEEIAQTVSVVIFAQSTTRWVGGLWLGETKTCVNFMVTRFHHCMVNTMSRTALTYFKALTKRVQLCMVIYILIRKQYLLNSPTGSKWPKYITKTPPLYFGTSK